MTQISGTLRRRETNAPSLTLSQAVVHHAKPLAEDEKQKVSEQRKKLWRDITAFVQAHGAAVTSIPGASQLRFEVAQGSDLPQRLAAHNCPAVFRNRETRIVSSGFTVRDIYEIVIPR